MEVNGVLVHVYKGQVSAALNQTLIPYFGLILQNLEAHEDYEIRKYFLLFSDNHIVNGICFLCDILEHGGDDIFNLAATRGVEKFIETFERFPLNRNLLQSAGYGLGVVAQRSPKGSFPQLEKVAKILHAVIAEEDSRNNEEKVESTDNIISAFGKLVMFQFDGQIIGLPALKELLSLLPIYMDSEEAQAIHLLFFDQILKRNPVLFQVEVEADLKLTVQRIVNVAKSREDLELLDDEGKQKAQLIIEGKF